MVALATGHDVPRAGVHRTPPIEALYFDDDVDDAVEALYFDEPDVDVASREVRQLLGDGLEDERARALTQAAVCRVHLVDRRDHRGVLDGLVAAEHSVQLLPVPCVVELLPTGDRRDHGRAPTFVFRTALDFP